MNYYIISILITNNLQLTNMSEKILHFPKIMGGIDVQFLIGKNAKDNFRIIDLAKPADIWFHVEDKPSCHIVAILPERVNKKDLRYIVKQGAVLCKQHSKYVSEKNLPIIFTTIDNVVKTDTPGCVETRYVKRVFI
jgi:predicted ribosome quality control (RQC) complex YloA/Tae2 family protein